VLILAILLAGMMIGALAQFILGRNGERVDWAMALIAGLGGSFVGGLLFSLIASDGIALKPSGLIGSIIGAVIVTAIWQSVGSRQRAATSAQAKASARSGKHH
jgi:uncharacterized membrane protein YeaQ/YmgE (transglycosylase-associated protein family)